METDKNERSIDKNVDFNKILMSLRKGAYRCIGIGSGRVVFDLENGYVVKAAKNAKGIGQNEAEYRIASTDDSGLFAEISATSEKFGLLIMKKAERIRNISFVWNYFHVENNQALYRVQKLQDISKKYGLVLADLGRSVNWGKIDGKPVIIDYGFTKEVRNNFYMPLIFRILGG